MATTAREIESAKFKAGLLFGFFLLLLCVVAGLGSAHPARPVTLLSEDVPFLVRLGIVLIGWGLSWWAGKSIFKFLLDNWIPVGEATGGGLSFVFFMALMFLLVAGSGELHWAVAILLVILLVCFSIPVLWRLVGGGMMAFMLVLGLAALVAAHFLA
jgi:hypothetical protein